MGMESSDSAAGNQGLDGVHGISYNGFGSGAAGVNFAGGDGIFGGQVPGGFAGYFSGNVKVTGSLSKGGGSFKIDHPLDPANQYLYHSFVESPDMMNIYNGNVRQTHKATPWWLSPNGSRS
jgi:hypothetical protein